MERRERVAHVEVMCRWWDEHVGERPDNLASVLGAFLKDMGVKAVWTALDLASRKDALRDSEDVLEDARDRIRRWRRTKVHQPARQMGSAIAARYGEET